MPPSWCSKLSQDKKRWLLLAPDADAGAATIALMTRRFKVLVEHELAEDVWVTSVPGLNWLSTYCESRQEALQQTRRTILGYFKANSGPPSR